MLPRPRSAARPIDVVEELLLEVEDLDPALGADPARPCRACSSRCRGRSRAALARRRRQHRAQPVAGDDRVRRFDPEALPVGAGGRVLAPPEGGAEVASAGQRRAACGRASVQPVEREADPVLAGVDPQEGDFAEVDGEDAVLGLDVVPAALLDLLAEVLQLVSVSRTETTWPPSKPISTFCASAISAPLRAVRRSRSARRRSSAGAGRRPGSRGSDPRLAVDQLDAGGGELPRVASMSSTA